MTEAKCSNCVHWTKDTGECYSLGMLVSLDWPLTADKFPVMDGEQGCNFFEVKP